MPLENIGPAPRTTTQRTSRSAAAACERLAQAEDQLVVERVALLGTVEDDVADGAAVLGQDGAHARIMTAFQLASRPLMLRPLPHRGDVVAAGAVALAALVALLQVRFDHTWDEGIHFVYSAAALALVGTLALRAPREGDAPRAYVSALLAVTFALAVPTLARLALILGSDGLDSSGTLVWAGAALAALGFGLAAARGSELCVLLGAVSLVLAVLGFVDVVFSPGGVTTFRWLLLALVAGFALATVATRDRRPKRAVALADAGGLTALALALTFALDQLFGSSPLFGPGAGTGWEAFLYACGFGLCAFSAVDRAPGPGWIGVAVLLATTVTAAGGKATLVGWPLVLAIGAGGLLVIGLRPSRPLPPDPSVGEAHVFEIRSER